MAWNRNPSVPLIFCPHQEDIWNLSASVQLSYLYTSVRICSSQNNILRLLLTCHFPLFSYGFLVCVNKTWDLRPDSSLHLFTTANITLHRSCPGYICQLQQDLTNLYQLQTLFMVFYIHLAVAHKITEAAVQESEKFSPLPSSTHIFHLCVKHLLHSRRYTDMQHQ